MGDLHEAPDIVFTEYGAVVAISEMNQWLEDLSLWLSMSCCFFVCFVSLFFLILFIER